MKWFPLISSLVLSTLLIGTANAGVEETTRETDTHIIHFNVFNSSFLTPEIAQQYGLKRSKYHSMLNLAVHEKGATEDKPIPVILQGTVTNIVQQQRSLEFQEIQEGSAIYYISDFRVTDDDLLTFDIKIRTNADSPGYDLKFKRRVFTGK
ncbi:MAG: DUF4426 domain-containing protein [Pseudomonadales bacterium]